MPLLLLCHPKFRDAWNAAAKETRAHWAPKLYGLGTYMEGKPKIALRVEKVKNSKPAIWELKTTFKGEELRILFCVNGSNAIWLLHMFTKKSQKLPKTDKETAENRRKELEIGSIDAVQTTLH